MWVVTLIIVLIIVGLYYISLYREPFILRATSANTHLLPIVNNILNEKDPVWSAPNMVNFEQTIKDIEYVTKRRPWLIPNEETFTGTIEGYRPGDWRINGYITAQAIENMK